MADIKRKFRAEDGLDAGGDKIINVALADRAVGTDGVNVDFLVQENTVQQYDPTRGYPKNFVALYDSRFVICTVPTPVPAGAFNTNYWKAVRTDASWKTVSAGAYQLNPGDSISVDTAPGTDITFTLPGNPLDGDSVVLKDIGGNTGYAKVTVNASVQSLVNSKGQQVRSIVMTHPRAEMLLVFSNRLWYVYAADNSRRAITVTPASIFRAQANDQIVRRFTSGEKINITLPRNANDGDIINVVDLDALNPLYHTLYTTFDATTSVGAVGQRSVETRTSGEAFFMFDAADSLWRLWTGDLRSRLRLIREDANIRPNDHVLLYGTDNVTQGTINLSLPTDVAIGDTVKISLTYIRKGQTVKIKAASGDVIATNLNLLQFPKRSEYPPDAAWVSVTELEFNGTTSYVPVLELSYIEDIASGTNYWVVQQNVVTVERVDSKDDTTRARLGVIALANQNQANIDHENSPAKELAITPETLANRTATETRRGLARIATTAQVNQNTVFAFQDDLIVSPKKLNERTATETRRGLAEIATQAETDAGTDDTTIVTPKKLAARKATEATDGIIQLVSTNTTNPGTTRGTAGTNVYNFADQLKAVTPKALFQNKATQQAQGQVYLALESETIAGATQSGYSNAVVTPETLHARTALDSRTGLIEIATQAETNTGTDYTRAVTPKTLNDRNATQTLTGIARIGTQVEFDAGVLDNVISTPLKVKTHFNSSARTEVIGLSGLTESGTLWDHYTLNILEANETQRGTLRTATQLEAAAGLLDNTVITPKKLLGTKATEGQEGLVKIATQAETVAGTSINTAVSPKNLKYIAQTETSWEATPLRRGFVKSSEGAISFVGNDTQGSTQALDLYTKNGYAITPYEFNRVLANYLPLKAKAVDSDLLDGLDSLQFIRRDIDQTVNSSLTLTKQLNLSAPLVSSSTAAFTTVTASDSVSAVNKFSTKLWDISSSRNTFLDIGYNAVNKFSISSTGDATLTGKLSAASVDATGGYSVEGGVMVIKPTTSELVIGTQSKKTFIQTSDANTLSTTDTSGSYTILNMKNAQTLLNPTYVRKAGDSMTGSLGISGTLTVQIPVGTISPDTVPVTANANSWTVAVTDPLVYNKLPGFAVPEYGYDTENPELLYVIRYSPMFDTGAGAAYHNTGVLSQHGVGTKNLYQIWSVDRPATVLGQGSYVPSSMYTRSFNSVLNKWERWTRMMTTDSPPIASEIGAASSVGSEFANLKIRDWIQIGNVRITPNPVTRSVDFTWVD